MADTKISALTGKTTPVNADSVPIYDSEAGATRQLTLTNLKAFLKTYNDTLYGRPVSGEVMGGSGINRTIANTPLSGTLKVFDGTVRLYVTTDYTVSGTDITFFLAPDDPRADYSF